ncbi:hypothetical protein LBBP_02440 [Leptospira borgpetersenii serovar Ballum]|uniref:Uncharacterized protein n=1 Tax=Leptospira borgpetersenii serovar Ballum TaxID=280505 RepID=A0A0S2IPM2_LEPBO|nr:hypothetical protein LBBP_01321 [Leptospira borgpetersenii serovar Ballum]ALO26682.1 hypothetical protein LBBP_02440 [Leptospira borgpetersenii serovar Ballum]
MAPLSGLKTRGEMRNIFFNTKKQQKDLNTWIKTVFRRSSIAATCHQSSECKNSYNFSKL